MTDYEKSNILEQIEAAGRKILPMHEYLAETDPEMLEAFNTFLNRSIYRKDGLDEGQKEMILACACLVGGSTQPVIANHCRRALAAGFDRDHLLQALEISAAVMATRGMAGGINALIEAEEI